MLLKYQLEPSALDGGMSNKRTTSYFNFQISKLFKIQCFNDSLNVLLESSFFVKKHEEQKHEALHDKTEKWSLQ